MLFNSFIFAWFLAGVLAAYYCLAHRWQNRLLLAASFVFYGAWDYRFLSLLAASTLIDYYVARAMDRTDRPGRRRALLAVSLIANLGLLAVFKYFNFFVDSLNTLTHAVGLGPVPWTIQVILPVGISFYTFQTLSYTLDVYWRKLAPCRSLLDFALYVSYFPQLVAGPIERAGRLLPAIMQPRVVTSAHITSGLQLMLMGYLKKIAIADTVAPFVDDIFTHADQKTSLQLLIGVYLFALQIYGDFGGYTDIARGVSRLFGIDLMLNFRQPYLSASITEFWRRWHISLSSWLRDYLYIPLGGNRGSAWRTARNLMLTMLLGGLWHGAAWGFVIWGGLHGLYLAIDKFILGRGKVAVGPPELSVVRQTVCNLRCGTGVSPVRVRASRPGISRVARYLAGTMSSLLQSMTFIAKVVLTFHLVCLTWIFFRAASFEQAWTYLAGLAQGTLHCELRLLATCGYALCLTLLIDLPCWAYDREYPLVESGRWYVRGVAHAAAVIVLSFVGSSHVAPFIYFQF